MGKADWTISGDGGLSVVEEGGSMRCQLTGSKLMLWNARSNLQDSEVVADVRLQTYSSNVSKGGAVLRSDPSGQNCYLFRTYGHRTWEIRKIVAGVEVLLGSANSLQPYSSYVKTRCRVDGFQLSIEEFLSGQWDLLLMAEDTDHTFLAGYAGLVGLSTGAYYMLFDNVEISELT